MRYLFALLFLFFIPTQKAQAQPTSKCCCGSINGDFCSTNVNDVPEVNMDGACVFGFFGSIGPSFTYSNTNDTCNGEIADSCVTACASLPVEFSSFSIIRLTDGLSLKWSTASESNNSHFDIEHSINRGNFLAVGQIEGAGTSDGERHYSFLIDNLDSGLHHFRIKQVDHDGSFDYTEEIEFVEILPVAYDLQKAYPNPFESVTRLGLSIAEEQSVRLEVFDLQGKTVAILHDGPLRAHVQNSFDFDASDLPSGLYLYKATGDRFVSSVGRITKLK